MKPTAESRACRSQARWTGICPERAQVRRRTGWSMKPLSSKKTMGLPRSDAPFLSAAIHASAIASWPRRPLRVPVVRDSGKSTLSREAFAQRNPGDTVREIAWQRPRRSDDTSKNRWDIRPSVVRPGEFRQVGVSASHSDGACGRDVVWLSRHPCLPFFTARRHRFTEDSETPRIFITSPLSLPSRINCPASRRRDSSSVALPFSLIP
jgi:hypothetical protein